MKLSRIAAVIMLTGLAVWGQTERRRSGTAVKLMDNGYLVLPSGKPFVPLGGFYANWPPRHLDNDSPKLGEVLDLFPTDAKRYSAGFPQAPQCRPYVPSSLSCAIGGKRA